MSEPVLGGVEAGGTKFVCVVGRAPDVRAEFTLQLFGFEAIS